MGFFQDEIIISKTPHKANVLLIGGSGHNGRKIVSQLLRSNYINSLTITGIEDKNEIRNNLNLDKLINSEDCQLTKEKINIIARFDVKDFALSWKVLEEFLHKNFVNNTRIVIHITLLPELYSYVLYILNCLLSMFYCNNEFLRYAKDKLYVFIEKPIIRSEINSFHSHSTALGYGNIDNLENVYLIDHYFGKNVIYDFVKMNRLNKIWNFHEEDYIFLPTGGKVNAEIDPITGFIKVRVNPHGGYAYNDYLNILFVCHEDDVNSYKHRSYFLNKYGIFYDMVYGHIISTLNLIKLNVLTFYYYDNVILDYLDKSLYFINTNVNNQISDINIDHLISFNLYELFSFNKILFRHESLPDGNENYILIQDPFIEIIEGDNQPVFRHSTVISCGKLTGEHRKFLYMDVQKDDSKDDGISFNGYLYIELYPKPKISYELNFTNRKENISFQREFYKEYDFERNEYINLYEDILSGQKILGNQLNISNDNSYNIAKRLINEDYEPVINSARKMIYKYKTFSNDIKTLLLEKLYPYKLFKDMEEIITT